MKLIGDAGATYVKGTVSRKGAQRQRRRRGSSPLGSWRGRWSALCCEGVVRGARQAVVNRTTTPTTPCSSLEMKTAITH